MMLPWGTPTLLFSSAILLRIILLLYGLYQDAISPLKYTDIDYFVFTDAARFVSRGVSPYYRDTYRYTPLLAYLLLPTTWKPRWVWFHFGKVLFAIADVVAGWLMYIILRRTNDGDDKKGMSKERALKFASIWLLNPMVATISTRGSSEGLLGVMSMGLLWAVLNRQIALTGMILGLAVHFKIYPFIYAVSIVWYLESPQSPATSTIPRSITELKYSTSRFFNESRTYLALSALSTFSALNLFMYIFHGPAFIHHTYLYHLTRSDHRHNFSPYNTLLYLSSARSATSQPGSTGGILGVPMESLAFLPQLLLSAILIPIILAKKDLAGTMLAQTWAFVTFNKVCTSQYFLWYLVFLPLYLPRSTLLARPRLGLLALALWITTQAVWLQQGYELEFLGRSTFFPGLFLSSIAFFAANIFILQIVVSDIAAMPVAEAPKIEETKPATKQTATKSKESSKTTGRRGDNGEKRYRNVLETYMDDLGVSGGGTGRESGKILGEVEGSESE